MRLEQVKRSATVKIYHQESKHFPHRPARSPGYLDWENQPVPFRSYQDAPKIRLPLPDKERELPYCALYDANSTPLSAISIASISTMLSLSMGLSAWKKMGNSEWALRINPSSGNLHPTECYLLLPGFEQHPACLTHYHPYLHLLEQTAIFNRQDTDKVSAIGGFGIILTSIAWREAWKYGERAYRYCQHDLGHALAALRFACNLNSWKITVIPQVAEQPLDRFLGFAQFPAVDGEVEHADCLCWVDGKEINAQKIAEWFAKQQPPHYQYPPNQLSAHHIDWELIARVQQAGQSTGTNIKQQNMPPLQTTSSLQALNSSYSAEAIIRKRRSAQSFDRNSSQIDCATFLDTLTKTLPGNSCPFDISPYPPQVHLAIFVHAVSGLESGLYMFVRTPQHLPLLQQQCDPSFQWQLVREGLPLYLLQKGDFRDKAQALSCDQAIAGDSAYSLGMIARFEPLLTEDASLYPRLFWETGLIGQVLYLQAEAFDLRGTGIGCFFDEQMHKLLGFKNNHWQSLYHFTVGKPIEDLRLETKAPYYHLQK